VAERLPAMTMIEGVRVFPSGIFVSPPRRKVKKVIFQLGKSHPPRILTLRSSLGRMRKRMPERANASWAWALTLYFLDDEDDAVLLPVEGDEVARVRGHHGFAHELGLMGPYSVREVIQEQLTSRASGYRFLALQYDKTIWSENTRGRLDEGVATFCRIPAKQRSSIFQWGSSLDERGTDDISENGAPACRM
jgi:hypothetical protein